LSPLHAAISGKESAASSNFFIRFTQDGHAARADPRASLGLDRNRSPGFRTVARS
jgi:hypothetical protein